MMSRFRKAIRYNAQTNVVWDGNSLFTYTPSVPTLTMASSPISGAGAWSSVAIAGQTWRQMAGQDSGSSADVDAALQAGQASGRQNVLVLWEHTNAICNAGRTVQQTYADMLAYIDGRRAVDPGVRILVLGTIPRQGFTVTSAYSTVQDVNVALQQVDLLVQTNAAALDIGFLSLRQPGSPLSLSAFDEVDFVASGDIWIEGAGARIHLNTAGRSLIAPRVVTGLQRLVY